MSALSFDDIADNFSILDEWEDRYRYLIELGGTLAPMDSSLCTAETKVQGCASQVWLVIDWTGGGAAITTDSDAHIVKGLLAIVVSLYQGKTPEQIAQIDPWQQFRRIDLEAHLTPQRSNGLKSVVDRIRRTAEQRLQHA